MATAKAKFRALAGNNSQGQLYIQISHECQVRKINTPYTVYIDEWNDRKGILSASASPQRQKELNIIRLSLQHDLWRIKSIIANMESTRLFYDINEIMSEYQSYISRFSLTCFMKCRIDSLQLKSRIRTAQNYRSTLNSFMSFRNGEDIMIDSLTTELIDDYESFLQAKRLKPNTTSFYMRILRAVCNAAAEEGAYIQPKIFRHVYTGVDKTEKRALPLGIMKKIIALDLRSHPALDYARDMFLLSFLTRGMSFIDMAFLLKTDLRDGYLSYCRHKTRQRLTLKWTDEMQRIIDKYPPNASCYFLPILVNPQANQAYAYRNISYRINNSLKKIAQLAGYHKSFTLYSARHTWASIACMKGIPINIISQGMGHDSERTTRIYLSSIDSSAIDRANSKVINSIY